MTKVFNEDDKPTPDGTTAPQDPSIDEDRPTSPWGVGKDDK